MTEAERAIAFFKFIRDLSAMRSRLATDIKGCVRVLDPEPDGGVLLCVGRGESDEDLERYRSMRELHADLEREPDTLEIVAANGFFMDRDSPGIHWPLITRRARSVFDPRRNTVVIEDTDAATELCASIFQSVEGADLDALKTYGDALRDGDFHPFDAEEAPKFLEALVHSLSPDGVFSPDGEPEGWRERGRFLVYVKPMLIARRRADGVQKAVERIMENIGRTGWVPPHIADIVGAGSGAADEAPAEVPPIDVLLAEAGGEDLEIMLSKEANREQLEAARRTERSGGVLVQGPPGTGKTHTIANLIGHFLAKGMSVLVTSHTKKALSVLKNKVAPGLRPLCVSMTEDSGRDMEETVDYITEFIASHDSASLRRAAEASGAERARIAAELADVRRRLYEAMCAEAGTIEMNGEYITPARAAEFVRRHKCAGVIPGGIPFGTALPISGADLVWLYESNGLITPEEERAAADIPPREAVPEPEAFARSTERVSAMKRDVFEAAGARKWRVTYSDGGAMLETEHAKFAAGGAPKGALDELAAFLGGSRGLEGWMAAPAADGRRGGPHRSRWVKLTELIEHTASVVGEYEARGLASAAKRERKKCGAAWDDLMGRAGAPLWAALDPREPESSAALYVPEIKRCLEWQTDHRAELERLMGACGIPEAALGITGLDADAAVVSKTLGAMADALPAMVDICAKIGAVLDADASAASARRELKARADAGSALCAELLAAAESLDGEEYAAAHSKLAGLWEKKQTADRRAALLEKLAETAPEWAAAIRERRGAHGAAHLPEEIETAWQWEQYADITRRLAEAPFAALQAKSLELSRAYREATARHAEDLAWCELTAASERDVEMKQALNGWKLTMKKIGKGTGKNAARDRARARELMSRCQRAVPVWIMPIARALDTLDPRENIFDVLVIDEASQSDITEAAVLYMARRVIIVGDDRQVSPLAVGVPAEQVAALQQMHIEGVIPNAHLYDASTSIYDIAATTFRPLLLREHFRCAPEIIGFSDRLSYDGRILALRDPGDNRRVPAAAALRVDGRRSPDGKTNRVEALAVIALMKACMEQPEYDGATFGVMSMLGSEQSRMIQTLIFEHIDAEESERRRMICGIPGDLQGDERDVIILSIVDSGEDAPLRLRDFGAGDANRKRYNVAASRACDQMWVVHSLDPSRDLKPGDIRGRLIEYASAPPSEPAPSDDFARGELADSVAARLAELGFSIERGHRIGSYCLDIVARCGRARVAVECDGERPDGEAGVRADMEEQTILQRTGWKFIRVKGSEFCLDPDGTAARISQALAALGVRPCADEEQEARDDGGLYERVTARARELLDELIALDAEKNNKSQKR